MPSIAAEKNVTKNILGLTEGQTDIQTDGMTDICKTVYPSYDGAGYNDNEVNFVLDTNALLDFHS